MNDIFTEQMNEFLNWLESIDWFGISFCFAIVILALTPIAFGCGFLSFLFMVLLA